MAPTLLLHPDRLLPSDPAIRAIARDLLDGITDLPLVCPHGHVPIEWFRPDFRFPDATELLIRPDHYLLRMFLSQGWRYEDLGVAGAGSKDVADSRTVFRTFAANYDLFLATPSRLWLDHSLYEVLGLDEALNAASADRLFDRINEKLAAPEFSPRALFRRFGIEFLATTDSAVDDLSHHRSLREDRDWSGRVVPTFRPDSVTDPEHRDFAGDIVKLGQMTGEDVSTWPSYLAALRKRRAAFKALGATATDHGFATPQTVSLNQERCQHLLDRALSGSSSPEDSALFRAQMLYEMAKMSCEDGLVMQIHAGSWRNYAPGILNRFGLDRGFDIPQRTEWARGLKPLLDDFGFAPGLRIILYTLDETTYSRELAPLAGAFPVLRLGAPWWFFDSPLGMSRHFDAVIETAGFRNLAGFVDDTRAFLSIPARHDIYRRAVAGKLAHLVAEHQIGPGEAHRLARDLAVGLIRTAYNVEADGA